MARLPDGPSSEERRRQIVEAALRAFASKGFSGATTKDIACEAGVTPGLIYHYFDDKRALLHAIIAELAPIDEITSTLRSPELRAMEPRAFLQWFIERIGIQAKTERESAFHLLVGEAMRDPELSALFKAYMRQLAGGLAEYLDAQMRAGRLRQFGPTLVAQFLLSAIISTTIRRVVTDDPLLTAYSFDQLKDALIEIALEGLAAPTLDEHHAEEEPADRAADTTQSDPAAAPAPSPAPSSEAVYAM